MRKIFSVSSLILGVIFFVLFIVAACAAYYLTAGEFVSDKVAILYVALGLLGAIGVVFRAYVFAFLFYVGCALGWMTGHYVATLEGDFSDTAGVITTFFLIGVFALIGLLLQISHIKRRRRKKEKRQEAEERKEAERQEAEQRKEAERQEAERYKEAKQQEAERKRQEALARRKAKAGEEETRAEEAGEEEEETAGEPPLESPEEDTLLPK